MWRTVEQVANPIKGKIQYVVFEGKRKPRVSTVLSTLA